MDRCPSEIWANIFALACKDDGFTGRSLSLVSVYFNETSRSTKLQSLAVVGRKQMLGCASMLENTPTHLRRVRYLFLSSYVPPPSDAWDAQSTSREKGKLKLAPVISGVTYEEDVYRASLRILTAVASTVENLHVIFAFPRPTLLLPISLPALVELTLHGPFPAHASDDEAFEPFPSLRRLHLVDAPYYPSDGRIPSLTPALTHLRISAINSDFFEFNRALARTLSWRDSAEGRIWGVKLPPKIEKILFQPSQGPTTPGGGCYSSSYSYLLTMKEIRQVAQVDDRLIILEAQSPSRSTWGFFEAEREWLDRNNGQEGCWIG